MYAQQRHKQILDSVTADGRVTVSGLAQQFGVTTETIRRDLDHLSDNDLLVRVHGGAVARRTTVMEPDLGTRSDTNTEAKRRIGEAAARLLPRDSQAGLMIDAGSTTAQLIPHLAGRPGPVFTNSPEIASAALTHDVGEVHILPGRLRGETHAAVGADTVSALHRLRPAVVFLGCNGLDAEGFTTPDTAEAAVKRTMVERAGLRVVLADSSKIGARHLNAFAAVSDIDVLVTDTALPVELDQTFHDFGTEVHRA